MFLFHGAMGQRKHEIIIWRSLPDGGTSWMDARQIAFGRVHLSAHHNAAPGAKSVIYDCAVCYAARSARDPDVDNTIPVLKLGLCLWRTSQGIYKTAFMWLNTCSIYSPKLLFGVTVLPRNKKTSYTKQTVILQDSTEIHVIVWPCNMNVSSQPVYTMSSWQWNLRLTWVEYRIDEFLHKRTEKTDDVENCSRTRTSIDVSLQAMLSVWLVFTV